MKKDNKYSKWWYWENLLCYLLRAWGETAGGEAVGLEIDTRARVRVIESSAQCGCVSLYARVETRWLIHWPLDRIPPPTHAAVPLPPVIAKQVLTHASAVIILVGWIYTDVNRKT